MVLEECTNIIILIVETAHYLIQSYVCDSFPALIFVVWLGKGHEENKEEKLARCKWRRDKRKGQEKNKDKGGQSLWGVRQNIDTMQVKENERKWEKKEQEIKSDKIKWNEGAT